ncbi:MAG: phosphatidylserine decarboxylase family protein [Bacteroides sp.]|nr:phosphatidylserine decarboxylase family protein [Bacteroidales bacterium]MBD5328202.1 phosphatidylserine decarboxylase family protein [Bacteroides sp.]MBD5415155.1 phosphatidylserine decarboxylase family protein [Bacteroides sp.]MDE6223230.1 phosphatidylserine decarboxylase family protein [Muribaculaceae bacterium]
MGKVRRTLKRVRLHREGTDILLVTLAFLVSFNVLVWWMSTPAGIAVTVISAILYLLLVNFYRSPKRHFTGRRENVVVSSVDGKVVALEETYESEYLKCRCIQLSVFMSPIDVHANWFPVDGEVIYVKHHDGRFMSAWLPKSSTENERSTVVIRTDDGQLVLMRQVAGAMARRIVTYAEPDTAANIEDHMGFIKLGSRVDLYLPLGTEIFAKIGDRTVGGMTIVGRLNPSTDPQLLKNE